MLPACHDSMIFKSFCIMYQTLNIVNPISRNHVSTSLDAFLGNMLKEPDTQGSYRPHNAKNSRLCVWSQPSSTWNNVLPKALTSLRVSFLSPVGLVQTLGDRMASQEDHELWVESPGFRYQLCHLWTVWFWASHPSSFSSGVGTLHRPCGGLE